MGAPDIKMPPAPPPAPDLADAAVRDAALAASQRALQGSRRRSFLTSLSSSSTSAPVVPVAAKTLLGQ